MNKYWNEVDADKFVEHIKDIVVFNSLSVIPDSEINKIREKLQKFNLGVVNSSERKNIIEDSVYDIITEIAEEERLNQSDTDDIFDSLEIFDNSYLITDKLPSNNNNIRYFSSIIISRDKYDWYWLSLSCYQYNLTTRFYAKKYTLYFKCDQIYGLLQLLDSPLFKPL